MDDPVTVKKSAMQRKKFLVVVDETPESRLSLYYAARRALHTNGHVSLLYVIEPPGFMHWIAVEKVMAEEARAEAEAVLYDLGEEVIKVSGLMPELVIREGKRRDELLALIREDPDIRVLVLGAGTGKKGPGPLVTCLAGEMAGSLPIPITVVPGNLSLEQLDQLA